MTTASSDTPPPLAVGRTEPTPSTASTAAVTSAASPRVTTTVGSALPAGNDCARRSPAAMASGLLEELVGSVEPGADLARGARGRAEEQDGDDDEDGRAGRDGVADPPPERPGVGEARLPDVRDLGPEDPATEDDERGGEDDECERRRDDDADRAGEPEAAGGRERGEQEGEQAQDHGRGARDDGLGRAPHGVGHRGPAVLGRAELVAVARDEQQRVVGAGAEDEDGQDPDRRLVPEDVGRREDAGGGHRSELVGDADDRQRHEPEERAAVGDDEQEGHDRGGGREEAGVRAVEDRGEVGLDGGRAGDLRRQPVGEVGLGGGADLRDDVGRLGRVVGTSRAR